MIDLDQFRTECGIRDWEELEGTGAYTGHPHVLLPLFEKALAYNNNPNFLTMQMLINFRRKGLGARIQTQYRNALVWLDRQIRDCLESKHGTVRPTATRTATRTILKSIPTDARRALRKTWDGVEMVEPAPPPDRTADLETPDGWNLWERYPYTMQDLEMECGPTALSMCGYYATHGGVLIEKETLRKEVEATKKISLATLRKRQDWRTEGTMARAMPHVLNEKFGLSAYSLHDQKKYFRRHFEKASYLKPLIFLVRRYGAEGAFSIDDTGGHFVVCVGLWKKEGDPSYGDSNYAVCLDPDLGAMISHKIPLFQSDQYQPKISIGRGPVPGSRGRVTVLISPF